MQLSVYTVHCLQYADLPRCPWLPGVPICICAYWMPRRYSQKETSHVQSTDRKRDRVVEETTGKPCHEGFQINVALAVRHNTIQCNSRLLNISKLTRAATAQHTHTHLYTHIHAYTYTHKHTHMHIHICPRTHTNTHTNTHAHTRPYALRRTVYTKCNIIVGLYAIHEKVPSLNSQFRQKTAWKEVGVNFCQKIFICSSEWHIFVVYNYACKFVIGRSIYIKSRKVCRVPSFSHWRWLTKGVGSYIFPQHMDQHFTTQYAN